MGALLDEFPMLQHANTVGLLNGRKPMGNDEAGPAGTKIFQCLLNQSLRLVVERGRRFIKQEERRILEERAGDRKTLFFPAGEAASALAGDCVEAVGAGANEVGRVRGFERGPEFLIGRVRFREKQVFAKAGVEEETFLGDVAELVAQPFFGKAFQWNLIDDDAAARARKNG